jgi:hypothetical protein
LRKTVNYDVGEMGFAKLLRNLEVQLKNDPYCMRTVGAVIRTAGDIRVGIQQLRPDQYPGRTEQRGGNFTCSPCAFGFAWVSLE